MRKIISFSFSKRILALGLLCAFAAALLPLYRLCMYAIPRYDDFSYGLKLWEMQRYGYGLRTIWEAGYRTAVDFHYCWQGTYASIFMMAQMPGALGTQYYFIGPVLLITSLAFGAFFMSMVLTGYYLKGEVSDRIIFSVIVTLTLIECIYTAQQGFFWYNSGVHYVFMHSLMFMMTGLLVIASRTEKLPVKILLGILITGFSFACAGANFVTCIQGILILTGFIVIVLVTSPKKVLWYLPAFFVYTFGLGLNLLAPGNEHRQSSYQGYGAVKSVTESLKAGVSNMWKFSGWFVVLLLLTAVPVIWMMVKRTDHRFRLPGLFTLLSYCFYCTGYTSSFYSMGNAGLSRTWIAVCFTFQILLFANEVYWIGYIAHNEKIMGVLRRLYKGGMRHFVLYYALMAVLMLTAFHFTLDKIGAVSSFGAYYYVHTGEAYAFHEEYLERVRMIEESDHTGVVTVPTYGYAPWFLVNKDISDDPSVEENRIMAEYFGVAGLRAVSRDEFYGN